MGCIERRQARILRIWQKLNKRNEVSREVLEHEQGPDSLEHQSDSIEHENEPNSLEYEKGPDSWASAPSYHIGKTQNHFLELGAFVRDKKNDPATKVMFYSLLISFNTLKFF